MHHRRESRRKRECEALLRYLADQPSIVCTFDDNEAPFSGLTLEFTRAGLLPPIPGQSPTIGHHHIVSVRLPADYPTRGPRLRWLTPIFHPNVSPDGSEVCVDTWAAGRTLPELCRQLAEMISFENFDYHPGYETVSPNPQAAAWVAAHLAELPLRDTS